DQTNLPFRRIVDGRLKAGTHGSGYRVKRVEPMLSGYWKAFVEVGGGYEVVWYFHPVNGKWLLAEPLEKELGERRKRETAHLRLDYWAGDEPLVGKIADVVERAYVRVTSRLRKEPDVVEQGKKVQAKLAPVYAVNPGLFKENVLASYPSGTKSMIF